MRHILTGALALLCCLTLAATALAEISFLPGIADWELEDIPLELKLTADVTAWAPFGEDRLPQIAGLMKHLALRITRQPLEDETQSTIDLLVDGESALSLGIQRTGQRAMAQFSALPDATYAGSDPLAALLGTSAEPMTILGMNGSESAWVTEGYELLGALETVLTPYLTSEGKVKTDIKNIGTARLKQDYTVSKTDAPGLTALLSAACPEGRLRALISGLVFSGKQTLRVYRDADHAPLRIEWNGVCGPDEDHLRNVKLTWRLRRDDTAYRDEISLTSPAVKGTDRNTLTWSCALTRDKSGLPVLTCDLSYTSSVDKQKTVWTGSCKLTSETDGADTRVTGEAKLSRQLPDESSATTYAFTPDITFSGDVNVPAIDGTLTVASMDGKKVLSQATLTLGLRRGDYSAWQMRETTVDLSALDDASLEDVRQQTARAISATLLRRLALLPREDLDYLFKDLPEESVQEIINAAQSH